MTRILVTKQHSYTARKSDAWERLACGAPFTMMLLLLLLMMMMMMPIFMRIEKLHVTCMCAATRLYTVHLYISGVWTTVSVIPKRGPRVSMGMACLRWAMAAKALHT